MGYLNTTTALPSTISTSCEVPSTRWTTSCRGLKKDLRPLRRILTHRPQHRKQKQKPWAPQPQQTEHVGMLARNNIRCECHVGIPSGHRQRDRPNRRKERKCVICSGPHWASQCPEIKGNLARRTEKRSHVRRTTNLLLLCTQRRACSQGKPWKQERL